MKISFCSFLTIEKVNFYFVCRKNYAILMTQLKDSILELNIHTYLVRRFLGNLCGHAQTFAND